MSAACGYHSVWKSPKNIATFQFGHFPPIFVPLKVTSLVTMLDRKLQFFKNWRFFGIFTERLSNQNVNIARKSQCWMKHLQWFSNNVRVFCNLLGFPELSCKFLKVWLHWHWKEEAHRWGQKYIYFLRVHRVRPLFPIKHSSTVEQLRRQ